VFATVLSPLYDAVAWIINTIHSGLAHITTAGWTWGLSIILLTILMRLLLFPLFVKQIKSQREMQLLQPKIAALKLEFPDDRAKQSEAQMALFKEHGVNPFSGCLPLVIQLPVFFALFGVLHKFTVGKDGNYHGYAHLSAATVKDVATSKFFGVPIAAAFNSSKTKLAELNANAGTVKTVTIIMIVLMMVTTYLTSRQMISRSKASGLPSAPGQDATAKVMLYGMPLIFGVLGINFQMGVLLYWLTTNLWTFGQQGYVLSRMSDDPDQIVGKVPAPG
jgi:YidC/Oxa1 family membrane protein insertase